jgi:hypothetical protein
MLVEGIHAAHIKPLDDVRDIERKLTGTENNRLREKWISRPAGKIIRAISLPPVI